MHTGTRPGNSEGCGRVFSHSRVRSSQMGILACTNSSRITSDFYCQGWKDGCTAVIPTIDSAGTPPSCRGRGRVGPFSRRCVSTHTIGTPLRTVHRLRERIFDSARSRKGKCPLLQRRMHRKRIISGRVTQAGFTSAGPGFNFWCSRSQNGPVRVHTPKSHEPV